MSGALDAIGFIGDALGIFSFLKDLLPSGPQGAVVRIRTGHQFEEDQNFGGDIGTIDGYDTFNKLLGSSGGGHVDDNSYADYTLDQSDPGNQVKYITIRNDNDATCILYATLNNVDDTLPPGAWIGDIGFQCGQTWYYGNTTVGTDNNGNSVQPKCTWLDADHTNDIVSAAMKINFQAYGQKVQNTLNEGLSCSATIFASGNGEIDGAPSDPSKRSLSMRTTHNLPRKSWMLDQLIVSTIRSQTAKELCEHPMSWGADFIGSDGYFCDMSSHELSPLCSTRNSPGCVTLNNMRIKRTTRGSSPQREHEVHHIYKGVSRYFD